jgi:hypothetical protein
VKEVTYSLFHFFTFSLHLTDIEAVDRAVGEERVDLDLVQIESPFCERRLQVIVERNCDRI